MFFLKEKLQCTACLKALQCASLHIWEFLGDWTKSLKEETTIFLKYTLRFCQLLYFIEPPFKSLSKQLVNENLGVSNENMGSPMKSLESPIKIWGSPMKIWGLWRKSGGFPWKDLGFQWKTGGFQRESGASNETSMGVSNSTPMLMFFSPNFFIVITLYYLFMEETTKFSL